MNQTQDDIPTAAKALRDQILRLRLDLVRARTRYFITFLAMTVILTTLVTGGLLWFYPHVNAIFPLAVLLPLLLSFTVFRVSDAFYRRRTRLMLIESLTVTSGFTFSGAGYVGKKDLTPHAICPATDTIKAHDGFNGAYHDITLSLQDLILGKKPTQMRCIAARIQLRKPIEGHTVVVTTNAARAYFKDRFSNYGKVGVSNPKYDRQVDIFATERTEGRLMADAVFLELLMETGGLLKSRWVAASFLKNDIVMIFDAARPLLHLPPLWSPVTTESLMRVYREFESFFKIIDAARANRYM